MQTVNFHYMRELLMYVQKLLFLMNTCKSGAERMQQ